MLRKVATKLASGDATTPVTIDGGDVRTYLGRPKFFFEAAERTRRARASRPASR